MRYSCREICICFIFLLFFFFAFARNTMCRPFIWENFWKATDITEKLQIRNQIRCVSCWHELKLWKIIIFFCLFNVEMAFFLHFAMFRFTYASDCYAKQENSRTYALVAQFYLIFLYLKSLWILKIEKYLLGANKENKKIARILNTRNEYQKFPNMDINDKNEFWIKSF